MPTVYEHTDLHPVTLTISTPSHTTKTSDNGDDLSPASFILVGMLQCGESKMVSESLKSIAEKSFLRW